MSKRKGRKDPRHQARLKKKIESEEPFLELLYNPIALLAAGPGITTNLFVTESHAAALKAGGHDVPRGVNCRWLLDTGADGI